MGTEMGLRDSPRGKTTAVAVKMFKCKFSSPVTSRALQ